MQLPTGFMETEAHGFHIITRPAYYATALEVAARDPETLLALESGAPESGAPESGAPESGAPGRPGPMQGRGPRLEMPGEGGETIILKKQLRGGLYRRLMGDVYKDDYHSVAEVFISETAWKKGVPVALLAFAMSAPAGEGRLASYRRSYVASIKLEGARSLMEWLSAPLSPAERRSILTAAAQAIDRAHDRGFKHGDLNLGNVLVVRSKQGEYSAWLIDLLHSTLGGALGFRPRVDNLVRLYRSAEKWLPEPDARRRLHDVVTFLRAYTFGEPEAVRRYLKGAAKRRTSLLLHRLGWRAAGSGAVTPRRDAPAGG